MNPHKAISPFVAHNAERSPTNQYIKAKREGRRIEISDETRQKLSVSNRNRIVTDEFREIMAAHAHRRRLGGVRPSKRIEYNGVYLGSSYELAVAMALDENDVEWIQPSRLKYKDKTGRDRTYTADFYLPLYDVYLDPKNDFLINNINPRLGFSDRDKISWVMEQNEVVIIILDKTQLSWSQIQIKIANLAQR